MPGCAGWLMARLGSKLCPGKEQAEPGIPVPVEQLSAAREGGAGDAGSEEQLVGRGNPTAWGCQGEEGVTPQDKRQGVTRHLGWQDLRTEEVTAKAREGKWLESVKAVDRGGRG